MIMGFPGSTERYLTQSEVKQSMNAVNQAMIDMRGVRLEVLRKYMDCLLYTSGAGRCQSG